jgi:hypothetical protein
MAPARRTPRAGHASIRGRLLALAAWSLAAGAGCQVFMDLDVSGYDAAPAAKCGSDGGPPCLSLGCASQADCDGGGVCCLTLGSGGSTSPSEAAIACQQGPCSLSGMQLCLSDSECGGTGSCTECTLFEVGVHVCDSMLTSLLCIPP